MFRNRNVAGKPEKALHELGITDGDELVVKAHLKDAIRNIT